MAVKTREMSAKSSGTSKVCYTNCGQLMIPILSRGLCSNEMALLSLWYCDAAVLSLQGSCFNPSDYHKVPVSTIMQFITGVGMLMG